MIRSMERESLNGKMDVNILVHGLLVRLYTIDEHNYRSVAWNWDLLYR